MNYLEFVVLVYIMGFMTAIPVGATQVEIAKRSLEGYLLPAFMVVLGSVSSDVIYGAIAIFGIASFLQNPTVMLYFWLISAILLLVLGVLTIRDSRRPTSARLGVTLLRGKRLSYITGFCLAATNPMMIVWWLFGLHVVKDLHLVDVSTWSVSMTFLLVGGLGLGSYLSLLMLSLHKTKQFISAKLQERIRFCLGFGLLALAGYFFVKSIHTWVHL